MPRTRVTRLVERQRDERALLDALLDSARVAHVGLVDEGGHPVVLPTAVARDGDRVLLHGSTGSRWMRRVASGVPVCVALSALDGLVVARSAFESSFSYRSAVLFGTCERLEGADKARGLDRLVDTLLPGRRAEIRPPTTAELRQTMVLALEIGEWSMKVADGWPEDGPEDVAGPAWAGIVPLTLAAGPPRGAPDCAAEIPVPPSVRALVDSPPTSR